MKKNPKKDHPDQAVDTDVPDGEFINEDAWESMRAHALEQGDDDDE